MTDIATSDIVAQTGDRRQSQQNSEGSRSLHNIDRKSEMVIQVKWNQRVDLSIVQLDRSLRQAIECVQLARRHQPAKNVPVIPHRRSRDQTMGLIARSARRSLKLLPFSAATATRAGGRRIDVVFTVARADEPH
jgi:hypothetical protein